MKIRFRQIAAAALLALCANPANADDGATASVPTSGWSGFFVGLHAGHTWGTSTSKDELEFDILNDEMNIDGFSGGALAGYNFQFDRIVFGVEADMSGEDMRQAPRDFDLGGVQSAQIDYAETWRGRLGYDMGDWMPFVTAGLGIADVEFTDAYGGVVESDRHMFTGFVVGGGADFKLDSLLSTGTDGNLIGRIEYMYGDYGNEDFQLDNLDIGSSDLKTHTLRAALIWRFP